MLQPFSHYKIPYLLMQVIQHVSNMIYHACPEFDLLKKNTLTRTFRELDKHLISAICENNLKLNLQRKIKMKRRNMYAYQKLVSCYMMKSIAYRLALARNQPTQDHFPSNLHEISWPNWESPNFHCYHL